MLLPFSLHLWCCGVWRVQWGHYGCAFWIRLHTVQSRVLIASYETFRAHAHRVASVPIDLVICDEAHRLKNDKTKTSLAISQLPAKRRLLLSGTPIQNDLDEFFALVSLCNPSVVGKTQHSQRSTGVLRLLFTLDVSFFHFTWHCANPDFLPVAVIRRCSYV